MDISPAAISQSLALFQSQALGALFGSDSSGASDVFSTLLARKTSGNQASSDLASLLSPNAETKGLSSNGRNLALFDPESAYNMMSFINSRDVLYKAQFSELNQMKTGVTQLQAAGQGLAAITTDTPPAGVEALLQNFVERYNHWRESFNADVEQGGLLDNMQAAEVSLYELEQSVKYNFFGAKDGIHGLRDLGVSIDPATHMAALDSKQLHATLSANQQGTVTAIQEFSLNFAKSARLLNSENNFIPNQLDNLSRVIRYITDNKTALRQEFGSGDAAKPSGKVAQALAAYQQIYG
jgi:hypothetical protein